MKKLFFYVSILLVGLTGFFTLYFSQGKQTKTDENSTQTRSSQVALIATNSDLSTLDTRVARDLTSLSILKNLYEGLTRRAPNGEIDLALAEKIDISEDLLTYTIHLRSAQWSNGDPVQSSDFIDTWTSALSPQFPSPYAYQLYPIKNAKKLKEGAVSKEEVGLKTIDSKTFSITLESLSGCFLEMLSLPIFFALHPSEHHRETSSNPKDFPPFNGPFVLKEWNKENKFVLEKNSLYWDEEKVKLPRAEFLICHENTALLLFEKGELDLIGSPLGSLPIESLDQLRKKEGFETIEAAGTQFLRCNVDSPFLKDERIRQAIAYSIDREAIVEHVLMGNQKPAYGLVPPKMYKHCEAKSYFKNALTKANALVNSFLEEHRLTRQEIRLSLTFAGTSGGNSTNKKVGQAIQAQIQENLGLSLELKALESKLFFECVKNREYEMANANWFADISDPSDFLKVFQYKDEGANNTGWGTPKYSRLIEESNSVTDEKKRQEKLLKAESILLEEMPIIPLYHYAFNLVKNPCFKDVVVSELGTIDFKWSKLEK